MNYIFLKSPYNINAFLQWNEQYYTRTTKKVSFKALIEQSSIEEKEKGNLVLDQPLKYCLTSPKFKHPYSEIR